MKTDLVHARLFWQAVLVGGALAFGGNSAVGLVEGTLEFGRHGALRFNESFKGTSWQALPTTEFQ